MAVTISYRPNTQKIEGAFRRVLTPSILKDICMRITGQHRYRVVENNDTYNKGRLLMLNHNGITHYITLSETNIGGRNSSLQSVPTAINLFYSDSNPHKQLWYYFLPHSGNAFTDYHLVYYRLMLTAGIQFLNIADYYQDSLNAFASIDEIIDARNQNRNSNRSNNSSFVSKTQDRIQLYAKTYGASKYESTVFGVALSRIADRPIDVFAVSEQDLQNLPASSLSTFETLGNLSIYNTSLRLDRLVADTEDTIRLRSAAYHYNLLSRIGMKKCAICGCEIPEIIHGAHIWGVAEIRNCDRINDEQRYMHATSGHNGLWLCHNHHKLFDSNLLAISSDGRCLIKRHIPESHEHFIHESILNPIINVEFLSDNFRYYLSERNQWLDLSYYIAV